MMFITKIILSSKDGDNMKTCFMFGHATTPDIALQMRQALDHCYEVLGIRSFVVGSRGSFDCQQAAAGLRYLKEKHDDVQVLRLIAYHPALKRPETQILPPFDATYYPEGLTATPNAYAIRKANEIMVRQADLLLCYVCHPGNTEKLLRYAQNRGIPYINLAESFPNAEL